MEDIYFNFSESMSELTSAMPTAVVGNPIQQIDPDTGDLCLYLDGNSAIKLQELLVEKKNFTIECIFRNALPVKEQGIYGSNGFRLALRSDRGSMSYTGWVNFPSSVSPKRFVKQVSPDLMCKRHYSVMTRKGNTFSFYLDGELVGTFDYDYNFWQVPFYIGYYYDMIYAFTGYIKEFKISLNKVLIPNTEIPIPTTLRDNQYEIG
jgi:hypothetical protein